MAVHRRPTSYSQTGGPISERCLAVSDLPPTGVDAASLWNWCPKSQSVTLILCPGAASMSHSGPPSMHSAAGALDDDSVEEEEEAMLDR